MADLDWMQGATPTPTPQSNPSSGLDWMGGSPMPAPKPATPTRPAGVGGNPLTSLTALAGQAGQTWDDLVNAHHTQHDANPLEQGIMDVASSKPVQYLQGAWDSAVSSGPFMNGVPSPTRVGMQIAGNLTGHPEMGSTGQIPMGALQGDVPGVRDVMERLGVGRQHGESDASLHQRYNDAVTQSRLQAEQQMQANKVGDYDGNPLHVAERFGQQVSGLGAGMAANPQYFVVPGMGVGSNAAARIATSGAGNAGLGAVSDAAAQLMDIAEGQKKDFDIEQNLKATVTGGLFGAALHGAVEVPTFIKGLYAQRGMDTTPSETPNLNLQPLTSDQAAMNAADHAQYQQLLQTGSVDDIKNFFKGRQGPQPSWTDVNHWVEHRDNPPAATNGVAGPDASRMPDFNYEAEYNRHAEQQSIENHRSAIEQHVQQQTSGWSNAPDTEVVHGPEQIADPEIRQQVMDADPKGDALGFFGADGKVRLFSGRINSPEVANAVLFHEGLGHFGLSQLFRGKLDQTMLSMADSNVGQFGRLVAQRQAAHPGESRALSAEEVLAERSQNGQIKKSWMLGLNSVIRRFARRMGMKLDMNDNEVQHVLSMAHDAVVNGQPDARANGFRNKFMFTGENATGFKTGKAFTANDGRLRNEISDRDARMYESPGDTLGSTIHHPELFEQYPELHGMKVNHINRPDLSFAGGYDADSRSIMINHGSIYTAGNPGDVVLHETQHAIQHIEQYPDFMRAFIHGGTGSDPQFSYNDHPSEIEARLTEKRRYMRDGNRENHPAKFMRHENRETDSGNFEIRHDTDVVGEPFIHVRPTEKIMSNDKYDNYDRGQAGLKAFRDTNYGWRVLNSNLPQSLRGQNLGREMYRELVKEIAPEQLHSDSQVSKDAQRLWEAAGGVRNPAARLDPHDGSYITRDHSPVYSVGEGGLKFMRSSQLNAAFEKLPPEHQEEWKQTGMRSHVSDWNYAVTQFDRLSRFVENNKHLLGTDTRQIIKDFIEQDHPVTQTAAGRRMLRAMSDTTRGPENAIVRLLHALKDKEHEKEQQMNALFEAKSPGGILENLPKHLVDHLEKNIDENGNLPPRLSMGNKFISRQQLENSRATQPGFEPDDIEAIAQHIEDHYTPNVMTREEVRQQALENGIRPDRLKGRDPGELAVRLAKLGYAAQYTSEKASKLLEKLDTPEWKPEDHVALAKIIAQRDALVAMYKGEGNELGRALQTAKMFKSFTNQHLSDIMDQLRESGSGLAALADPTNPNSVKFARQLKTALAGGNNPKGAAALMTGVVKPYWEQYLTTFHMNAMLSALSTHVKAPVDMMTGITRNVLEKTLALPVGQARQMYERMTGRTPTQGVEVAELFNHIHGLMTAVTDMEVYRAALHAAKTGDSSYVLNNGTRVPTNFQNQFGAISNPRIPGVSIPTDLISAQDTVFRSWEMNAQLMTVATREARLDLGPKATTSDVMALGRQKAQTPTSTMLKEAFDETQRTLLLNDNKLNSMINRARTYKPNMTFGERVGAFIASNLAPFIRVESNNLMNRIVQRSPLAFLDGYTRDQFKQGGAKADIAASKILYGSTLLGMYWLAAGQGKLTGAGPDNVDKYKNNIAGGWRPDAVYENGHYNTGGQLGMSINPFDYHNKTAQLVASARQAWEAGASPSNKVGSFLMAMGSVFSNLAGMSWISDFQPAVDAARAHGDSAVSSVANTLGGIASTWVPNGLNQAARLIDPNQRDTTSPDSPILGKISNSMQQAIPGLRESLPIKYSVYGTPLANGASLTGVHTMIPGLSGNGTTETQDPAERELDRLNFATPDHAVVTPVSHKVPTGEYDDDNKAVQRQLSPVEFEQYQHTAGRYIVDAVRQTMSTQGWQAMSDKERVQEVKSIESDQKSRAREELFGQ